MFAGALCPAEVRQHETFVNGCMPSRLLAAMNSRCRNRSPGRQGELTNIERYIGSRSRCRFVAGGASRPNTYAAQRNLALRAEAKEVVAGYTADQALRAAWLGQFAQSLTLAQSALRDRTESQRPHARTALAFALAGDAAKALPLIQELEGEAS